ncbi:MAG: hypothetical protein KAS32_08095 [Candidatus Peribacteraceae bacterium]|nr:hypothetical protein [Candidatus Peribacteraceae bacterium]
MFEQIFEWILYHNDAIYYPANVKQHINDKYDKKTFPQQEYFYFKETSLVYNEDLMFARNTTNYTKSVIILRDLRDVIEDISSCTFKSAEKVITNQIKLFEEYGEEYLNNTNKIPSNYKLFINYNKWLDEIPYRNHIANQLGFENTDTNIYLTTKNFKLRNKLRYRKYFTSYVKELNNKIINNGNSLYL